MNSQRNHIIAGPRTKIDYVHEMQHRRGDSFTFHYPVPSRDEQENCDLSQAYPCPKQESFIVHKGDYKHADLKHQTTVVLNSPQFTQPNLILYQRSKRSRRLHLCP